MVDPISGGIVAGAAIDVLSFITGSSKSSKASKAQREAQIEGYKEKIRTYEYNIERAQTEMAGTVGDIQREGAAFQRRQLANIAGSGAEIGTGTPLMNMIQTAAGIERDVMRTKQAYGQEIEFYEQEISEYRKLLPRLQRIKMDMGK